MIVTYKQDGRTLKLSFDEQGVWSGDDADVVRELNAVGVGFLGFTEYYPTAWHRVKAIANHFHGTLDTPEPEFVTGDVEGQVF